MPNGKVGYSVEPDPGAISEALIDFLEHDREEEFKANIRIEKRRFTWEKMVETIEKLDDEIAMRK